MGAGAGLFLPPCPLCLSASLWKLGPLHCWYETHHVLESSANYVYARDRSYKSSLEFGFALRISGDMPSKVSLRRVALLAAAAVIVVPGVRAWGSLGHEIVA